MEAVEAKEAKTDSHMTSTAAFVEGDIQEACDDACSICLKDFIESDPTAETNCKHEFHLQCVLECYLLYSVDANDANLEERTIQHLD